jgi:hypothetical protein
MALRRIITIKSNIVKKIKLFAAGIVLAALASSCSNETGVQYVALNHDGIKEVIKADSDIYEAKDSVYVNIFTQKIETFPCENCSIDKYTIIKPLK